MAEEDSSQEKTEEATEQKKKKSVEQGQIVRSKEFNSFLVIFIGYVTFVMYIPAISQDLLAFTAEIFEFQRRWAFDVQDLNQALIFSIEKFSMNLISWLGTLFLATGIMISFVGGFHFQPEWLIPKFSKLNPVSGIKKMFSMNTLMELLKSIVKFILMLAIYIFIMYFTIDELSVLNKVDAQDGIIIGCQILMKSVFFLCLPFILIAVIDIPWQFYSHSKKMKMTKQEVKDEMKNTDGKPEVKGKQRQLQRQVSQRKMFEDVKTADVVLTNPEHYSVALSYSNEMQAPKVVAKGVDHMALHLRKIAKAHDVPIVRLPSLARSLYHTCTTDEFIPEGLYKACAHVLGFVFSLKKYKATGEGDKPEAPRHVDIPKELQY